MRYLGFAITLVGIGMIFISFLVFNRPIEGLEENLFFRPAVTLGGMVTAMGIFLTVALTLLRRRPDDDGS